MRRELSRTRLSVLFDGGLMEVEDEPAPLQPVLAPVDADSGDPGLEGRSLPKIVQVLIRAQKTLLRRAVGLAGIAKEPISDTRDLPLVASDEVFERFRSSGAHFFDEAALVDPGISLARNHGKGWHID